MLKLRFFIWLSLLSAVAGTAVFAQAPCPSYTTLDVYLTPGYSCTIGVFTVKEWFFQESAQGIPASSIQVTLSVQLSQFEFQFSGPFSLTGGGPITYSIFYYIDPPPPIIHGSQLDLDPSGSVSLQAVLCRDGSQPCSPPQQIATLETSTVFTTDSIMFEDDLSMLGVQNTLVVDGRFAPATTNGFDNIIFLDQPPSPPTIAKAFSATQLQLLGPGNTTALTFNIANPAANIPLSDIAFTDTLPAGLIVATPSNVTGSCGDGNITAAAGSNSISLQGASLDTGTMCTFSVDVTAIALGVQDNVTSPITAQRGDLAGNAAQASISVNDLFFLWFFSEASGSSGNH